MAKPQLNSHPEIAALIKSNNIEFVDLKFVDLPGIWQHFTIPVGKLDEDLFTEGIGFDGASRLIKISTSLMLKKRPTSNPPRDLWEKCWTLWPRTTIS